jgi:hypothetical protein
MINVDVIDNQTVISTGAVEENFKKLFIMFLFIFII